MSTYCVSKAKLLIQCENIDLFRKGDFFRQPSADLSELQLKGLLDVCQQSIQGRGFDAQKPFEKIQIADAFHFAYLCHFSVIQQNFASVGNHIIELACSHAIMETKISIFVHPIKKEPLYSPQQNPFDKEISVFQFPQLQFFPRIINASYFSEGLVEGCTYTVFHNCEAMSLIEYQYLFICYEPIKNTPCLIVSLETSFEEDKQNQKDGSSEDQKEELFFMCVFFTDTHKNLGVLPQKISVQQFEIYAKDIATQMLSTARKAHNQTS